MLGKTVNTCRLGSKHALKMLPHYRNARRIWIHPTCSFVGQLSSSIPDFPSASPSLAAPFPRPEHCLNSELFLDVLWLPCLHLNVPILFHISLSQCIRRLPIPTAVPKKTLSDFVQEKSAHELFRPCIIFAQGAQFWEEI